MTTGEIKSDAGRSWCLAEASDQELEQGLRELLGRSARVEAWVVAHLAEVEARRLHLRLGCASLYEYCLVRLELGDFEAWLRILAARVARKYPIVFEMLERREIHLTALRLLKDHLTLENHRELLAAAARKSKRQIELLLADRFPQADVPTRLQLLPTLSPLSPDRFHFELTISGELKAKLELARDLLSHANPAGDFAMVLERGTDLLLKQLMARKFGKLKQNERVAPSDARAAESDPRANRPVSGPAVSPAAAPQPVAESVAPTSGLVRAVEPVAPTSASQLAAELASRKDCVREHIPNEVRRRVVERDGLCCTYVSADGHRCSARAFLKIDHEQAWARGGAATFENLRLLCAQHNRLLAEHDFGEQHVATAMARRRGAA